MNLQEHMRTHHEEYVYACELCPKKFRNQSDLSKHNEAHTNNKFCHMYNNFPKCKYGTRCIFLHEKAKFCLFDGYCTRPSCQYRHKFGCLEKNKFSQNNFMNRKKITKETKEDGNKMKGNVEERKLDERKLDERKKLIPI